MARREEFSVRYLPVLTFSLAYVSTCLIGALFLLAQARPFVDLFEYFSGVRNPHFTGEQFGVALILLFVPPLALCLGFAVAEAGGRCFRRGATSAAISSEGPTRARFAAAAFCGSVVGAIVSLLRSGALENAAAWLSYQSWVDARWQNFEALTFVEFVNVYVFLPVAAAWLTVSIVGDSAKSRLLRWLPLASTVLLSALLYQKKAVLVAVVFVFATWVLHFSGFSFRGLSRRLATGFLVLVGLYFAMLLLPTFTMVASHRDQAVDHSTVPDFLRNRPLVGAVMFSLLAPLTRTSAPALYYPILYPDRHPLYGLDLGLDVLCSPRLGCSSTGMPDDNVVVWNYMNPDFHGGTIAAPFQFALYSQVGTMGAVLGGVLLGAALGAIWSVAKSCRFLPVWSSLLGAIALVMSVYLAVDSARNSIIASYGMIWAVLFLLVASCCVRVWLQIAWSREARRAEDSAQSS